MTAAARPYFEIANPEIPTILDKLPRELCVLDVGCGSGVHGQELKRLHGHRVVGVDLSEESIAKARTRLEEAYVADVTKPEQYPFFGRRSFDIIVFSDILEHLYNPAEVLERHLQLLSKSGLVVISLPNVAIWNVRLALLAGRFEYQDTGTLDRTHIRFFTRRTFERFLGETGLEVVGKRITPGVLRPFVPLIKKLYGGGSRIESDSSSIMDSAPYRLYMRWLYPIERALCCVWPGLLAFQFVILGRPAVPVAHQLEALHAGINLSESHLEKQAQ